MLDTSSVEQRITNQIQICQKLAASFHRSGSKSKALEYHKLRKRFQNDLDQLASHRSRGLLLPPFTLEPTEWEEQVINEHLSLEDLEIEIANISGVVNDSVWIVIEFLNNVKISTNICKASGRSLTFTIYRVQTQGMCAH